MSVPVRPAPPTTQSPARGLLARLGLALALSPALAVLISPGLSRGVPAYAVGEFTTATIRAPYDFSVVDEAATARKRQEAFEKAPAIVTLDAAVANAVKRRVAEAFAQVAPLLDQADARRVPSEADLRKLSASQRTALVKRRGDEADAALARALDATLPGFERALGVTLYPDHRVALARGRFGAPLARSATLLLDDLYGQPIVADRAHLRALFGDGDAEGPGRIVLRDAAGAERLVERLSALRTVDEVLASMGERAERVLANEPADTRRALVRLLEPQIVPNAAYDATATAARRTAAAEAVLPVSLTFRRNQSIVGEGQEVTPQTVLALRYLAARRLPTAFAWHFGGSALLFFLLLAPGLGMAGRALPDRSLQLRDLLFLAAGLVFTIALLRMWLVVADHVVAGQLAIPGLAIELLFPLAAAPMLTRFVLTEEASVVQLLVTAVAVGLLAELAVPMAAYTLALGLIGAQAVAGCTSRAGLVRAGVRVGAAAALGALAVSLLTRLDAGATATTVAFGAAGGFGSGLAVIALAPAVEWLFGYTSRISLLEMVSYEHPLLKRLMAEAPGTFQHSANISLLADAAATAIGADRLLARVGALYHDVGKVANRDHFIENQSGFNPHDHLSPIESARVLRAHVADGVQMIQHYGLSARIADFVREHHGTGVMKFFLDRARAGGGAPNEGDYRYPGPRPRSRETAVVMLADQVEATARTMPGGSSADDYAAMIAATVERVRGEGQLDQAPVTLRDLHEMGPAMVAVLLGMHHRRVEYPGQAAASQATPAT